MNIETTTMHLRRRRNSEDHCVRVTAWDGPDRVFEEIIWAAEEYRPDVKNKLGEMGAYGCSIRPDTTEAEARARDAIDRYARAKSLFTACSHAHTTVLPDWDTGFSARTHETCLGCGGINLPHEEFLGIPPRGGWVLGWSVEERESRETRAMALARGGSSRDGRGPRRLVDVGDPIVKSAV